MPEDKEKQNSNGSYLDKYQKHIASSCGYKLVYADDKFSKFSKSYFGKNTACNFINSMIEESNYCSEVMKNHFNKELVCVSFLMKNHFNKELVCVSFFP